MAKRRSLGRGLDALLSATTPRGDEAPAATESELKDIPIDLLHRGRYQPRVDMREESLAELAESIRAQGVVQPIVARPIASGGGEQQYEIVAGERRWRAAALAGLERVLAIFREVPDSAALAIALIENIQRENLNPVEEAASLRRLVDEFEMTHGEVAEAVGRSRTSVTNLLRLLELPPPVRQLLEERVLDMGHARAILGLASTELQTEIARRAVKHGWSVRATEQAVRHLNAGTAKSAGKQGKTSKDPDVARLEGDLSDRLAAKVELKHGPRGGTLVIHYHSLEELDGILEHIR
jgi:ParB family transcriptional regulator, chromosome partitioning protein